MAEPVLNPRKSRFAPPPGACDVHCHVYGPGTRLPELGIERLMALHRHFGFAHAVIVQADFSARANTVAALAASGGRYRGVALVDDETSEEELRALDDGGFRGVRFTFAAHLGGPPDPAVVRRVAERIRPLGWHIVFLMHPEDLVAHADLLRELPVPVVIDHMARVRANEGLAQPGFVALLEFLQRDNAWVKLSGPDRVSTAGPPFEDALPFAQALLAAAPERVMWGTDWPHPRNPWRPDDADLVDLLPRMAPDPAARRRLLVDNPARLYGF